MLHAPDLGGGFVDCHALDGYELYVLNQFENPTPTGWYTNNDRTAEQHPPPDSDPIPVTTIPGGRCVGFAPGANVATVCEDPAAPRGSCTRVYDTSSRAAVRITAGTMTDGGAFGHITRKHAPPADAPACPFKAGPPEVGPCSHGLGPSSPQPPGAHAVDDTSDWEGIVIWARIARGSASSIRVRVSDPLTDDKGCVCNPFTNQNDASDGCDKFGSFVALDDTFRAYRLPFAEMKQGGWGKKSPGLDHGDIFEMGIEYRGGPWDLWIDDWALYRRRP
jgi:hypothetical protein